MNEFINQFSRRRFLTQTGQGIGYAALAGLMAGDGKTWASEQSAPFDTLPRIGGVPGHPALCPQGRTGHLFAHGRRPEPNGLVRLQAGHEGLVRQGLARIDPQRSTFDDDDQRPIAVPDRAEQVQLCPVR